MKRLLFVLCGLILFQLISFAQTERCSAMIKLEQQQQEDPSMIERRKAIEQQIQDYINDPAREIVGDEIVIKVVFHVIHNGDALGTGENISDTYLLAQLDQINDDFRRMNSDADGTWSQAADAHIEFCLATEDPSGNPTTGITRTQFGTATWGMNQFDNNVKPSTIWDSDRYLNIWSANLSGGLLGWATFPGGPANEDGVVCLYSSFGSIATPQPGGAPYNIGRTCTHEIGHWLNCYHIWGDANNCSASDFCADTPSQFTNSGGCPSGPQYDSCQPIGTPGYMYQNYMDYTNDGCMNLFTEDQAARMDAVLNGVRSSIRDEPCGAGGGGGPAPCLAFDGGPYIDFDYADACALGGCQQLSATFEVWENESYILAGLIGGESYTFEFCSGYSASNWDAIITVGEYDNVNGNAVPGSDFAWVNGCSLTFTAPFDGDFLAVLSGVDNCGGAENTTNNGFPTFQCNGGCTTQCGITFTDEGGVNLNYLPNQNKTYVLCPDDPTCEVIEVAFSAFDLDAGDSMVVHDGDTTSDPQIGTYTGTTSPGTVTSTHSSGCLTFDFTSDADQGVGWEAVVNCNVVGSCGGACPGDYAGVNALTGNESGNGGVGNNGDYETDGDIESTQIITGGTVDYDSGSGILMNGPFEVQLGAEFDGFIDGCNGGLGGNTLIGSELDEDKRFKDQSRAKKTKLN